MAESHTLPRASSPVTQEPGTCYCGHNTHTSRTAARTLPPGTHASPAPAVLRLHWPPHPSRLLRRPLVRCPPVGVQVVYEASRHTPHCSRPLRLRLCPCLHPASAGFGRLHCCHPVRRPVRSGPHCGPQGLSPQSPGEGQTARSRLCWATKLSQVTGQPMTSCPPVGGSVLCRKR